MSTMQLPTWFGITGAVLKGLMIIGWRASENATVLRLLTVYDPVSFWLAELGISMIFGERRIAPSPSESLTFEFFLVLAFSLQCFVLGFAVQSIQRMLKRDSRDGPTLDRPPQA